MWRSSFVAATALAGLLVACDRAGAPEPGAEADAGEQGGAPALTPVDTPPSEEPVLGAVSRIDIEAELEAGAGCHVERDGKNLLAAVEGDAIAKPYGTLRHFDFHGEDAEGKAGPAGQEALWKGGRFTAGAITVTVTPEAGEGERLGEVTVREAKIVFSEEGQPESETISATWQCGS